MNGPQELHGVRHIMRQLQPERTCEQGCAGCEDCTDFDDSSAMVATKSTGIPGITVYDLGPSRNPDSAISRKLIEMGWTPPAARCDCGKKLASECEPWEPDCDLGKSAEHARPGRLDRSKIAAAVRAQQADPRCASCSAPLTADEVEHYGATCERCESKAFHAQQEADQVPDTGKKVTHLGQRRHDLARLVADIKAAVYAHSGQISTVEAIGALELAKHEIIGEQQ